MATRGVRGVVCALVLAGTATGAGAEGRKSLAAGGQLVPPPAGPAIATQADRQHVGLTTAYKGLSVRTTRSRTEGRLTIELQYQSDRVLIAVDRAAVTTVSRGNRQVRVDSPEALQQLQQLLGGSDAIVVFRMLLAERESVSDLQAPEFTLLAAAAFTASLVGDTDAPRRLADRFVQKHRGIFRLIAAGRGCWENYSSETSSAWNDLQACMDEANQDPSFWNGAYRRLACNAVWILRSESAWFEYIQCMNPLAISG